LPLLLGGTKKGAEGSEAFLIFVPERRADLGSFVAPRIRSAPLIQLHYTAPMGKTALHLEGGVH
jgi:hypothetical protein